ncbi:shikimate dehydrogenase [Desertihabitans brevis]|uniref:Shikimate dehydrogenase n=1 Tax=Desertihabitans brevis TaxID=2268447 RepID=A0A367YZL2_9ACTN|nr:shikimate dehydrogenase [Desertihabitans brevis]RCK71147.1 shikimate dehydrogenase [Desertihabitans brevis]
MDADRTVRVCAVLGDPIEHSLSPLLHQTAYRSLGLGWEYQRHRVDAAGLPAFVAGLDGRWRGLSLTMPLKEAALALGEPDETVLAVGAANTLLLDEPRRVRNTDVGGLRRALGSAGVETVGTALVLGTGATARSAVAALLGMGAARITVLARRPERAEPLVAMAAGSAGEVEVRPWAEAVAAGSLDPVDVAVSTVVAGAADALAPLVAGAAPVVFDVIYDPWPTVLAETAARTGATVVDGLDLLVHQAVLQVELMTGRTVDPGLLLSAGREAVGRPSPG